MTQNRSPFRDKDPRTQMELSQNSEGVESEAIGTKLGDFEQKKETSQTREKKYYQILRFSKVTLDLTTMYAADK